MCLHKHTTIVHQHLYNIKGVIYKSTGIVCRAVPAWHPTELLSAVSPPGELAQASVKRPGRDKAGVSTSGPVFWEAAGL